MPAFFDLVTLVTVTEASNSLGKIPFRYRYHHKEAKSYMEDETPRTRNDNAAGLAMVKARIDLIRRRDFAGKLPKVLAGIAASYLELAGEYLARGESIADILGALDLAADLWPRGRNMRR
jgi:hypothetical protein